MGCARDQKSRADRCRKCDFLVACDGSLIRGFCSPSVNLFTKWLISRFWAGGGVEGYAELVAEAVGSLLVTKRLRCHYFLMFEIYHLLDLG